MRARINGKIKATQVMLIDEHGADLGMLSLSNALALARSREKDLVEVDPESTPPVCQVIDYGKYRYQVQERRQNDWTSEEVIILSSYHFVLSF